MKLGWEVGKRIYGYSNQHKCIQKCFGEEYGIGENGSNLTIMFLSLNRSDSSLDLLRSIEANIPHFAGEVLIVDNGSTDEEKSILRAAMPAFPYKCRMAELDKNYGVSGGRNRGVQHVNTLWVMSLDNDMYFVGNPLDHLQETIDMFGCHFANLPFLQKDGVTIEGNGGHIYIFEEEEGYRVGQGSLFEPCTNTDDLVIEPSLGTFLYGTVACFRKDTFQRIGGFDEGMFVGFEDTDFSLTIFREGYKIGNSGGKPCIVHNHRAPKNENAKDAERVRHSKDLLKSAAEYFTGKNNLEIWTPTVDTWLKERHDTLELNSEGKANKSNVDSEAPWKKNIALVIDKKGWAFDNIANQIIKHLGKYYNFTKVYTNAFENPAQVIFAAQGNDLVHVFWREYIWAFQSEWTHGYVRNMGGNVDKFIEEYYNPLNISTAVYDHLLLGEEDMNNKVIPLFGKAKHYYSSSEKLNALYNELSRGGCIPKPTSLIQDGVDTTLFRPKNLERFGNIAGRPLRIGWVGNRNWTHVDDSYPDLKGLQTIIRPAVKELRERGYQVELVLSDRSGQAIPHRKMPDFYADIDLYVCASSIEGTPNPVLESMACGVPVISTDVGIVPEVFGELQREFILAERSIPALVERIECLLTTPAWFEKLSAENMENIQAWDWGKVVHKFHDFFSHCLNT